MTLLVIVLALFIERVWSSLAELRSFGWFERLVDRVAGKGPSRAMSGTAGVIAIVALPLAGVVIIHVLLGHILGILGFAFALLVLLFCLGPRDLDADVRCFLNAWEQGDQDKARGCAQRLCEASIEPVDQQSLGRYVVEGIVVAAHERWFGVIFWFIILGPLGALWYRLACVLRDKSIRRGEEDGFKEAALMLHHILAWIPVRLTLVGYALAGSFGDTLETLRNEGFDWKNGWLTNNYLLLIHGGLGALQLEQQLVADDTRIVGAGHVRAALGLVLRTLILAAAFIAVITVGSWAS